MQLPLSYGCNRRILRQFLSILSFYAIFPAAGFAQMQAGSSDSIKEEMLSIGFHKLFISYTGSPTARYTVVFESGGGGGAKDWDKVRSFLPKDIYTVAYDRAGTGKSGAGPLPRTMAQEVFELHELLGKARIKGPIILVGQSIGGLLVRLFTEQYGKEVAGLVLVDPAHESSFLGSMKYGGWVRLREKAAGKTIPKPQLRMKESPGYDSTADYLAEEFQKIHLSDSGRSHPLKNLPLIILGAGIRKQPPGTPDAQWKELRAERDRQVQELANLSGNSLFILDPASGHMIHYDNPEIVAKSIVKVIIALSSKSKLTNEKREASPIFSFHSGFWINLHHFIYYQALLRNPQTNKGLPLSDTITFAGMNLTDRKNWIAVLDYYKKNLVMKDLLDNRGMETIKNTLEDLEEKQVLINTGLSTDLEKRLNDVASGYRKFFWPNHHQQNQLWIKEMTPLVEKLGDSLRRELSNAYLSPWPSEAIRVDITNYASWSGAYTSLYPSRITISSADNREQEIARLETLFHEASHILIDSISSRIRSIIKSDNKWLPRRDLWHAVLFYTTGEIIKKHFPGYNPYAYQNGLWDRAWPMYISFLEKDWKPYLDGKFSFNDAIIKLVKDVEIDPQK